MQDSDFSLKNHSFSLKKCETTLFGGEATGKGNVEGKGVKID